MGWKANGTLDNVVLATFGDKESWSSGYNLFAERWLQTGVVLDVWYLMAHIDLRADAM